MGKLFRPGKIVIVLQGRFAGRKAVVTNVVDKSKATPFSRCVVAGIDRYPRKVHKKMTKKTIISRSRIRPFVKAYNPRHLLLTRYSLNIQNDLKGKASLAEPSKRKAFKQHLRSVFEQRYHDGKNRWFFTKLRF